MNRYYLNTNTLLNPNGNREVHKEGCHLLPLVANRIYLGYFDNAKEAVLKAKSLGYARVDGCIHCCPEAHHG